MVKEERLIDLFKRLCLINAPALEEREVAQYVKCVLQELQIEVWEDNAASKIGGNSNNILARIPATVSGAPAIFLSAHLDTVEPTTGLEIKDENGILSSNSDTILGADDKAGMAPIIEAIRCVLEHKIPHGEIVLLFSCAEEIGLKGADAIDLDALNLDFGFVLDTGPPVGTFVTRTATHDKIDIVVHGIPAHAGKDPEKGINAICVAADAINRIKVGRIGPETTSNLGIIEGGTAVNVVCPSVKIRGEARSTQISELDQVIHDMKSAFESASEDWGTTCDIDYKRHYGAYEIDPQEIVVLVATNAAKNLGLTGDLRTTLGGSDANIYNSKGVKSIVVATGMEKIHTHDEYVSRADLVKTTELVIELIKETALIAK